MNRADEPIYRFADFRFDTSSGDLHHGDRRVPLRPQAAQVLECLLRRAGELIRRDELQRLLWGSTAVDAEAGLNHCIRQVRRALADSAAAPRFVATEPRRGYRFIAPVQLEQRQERQPVLATIRGTMTKAAAGRSRSAMGFAAAIGATALVTALAVGIALDIPVPDRGIDDAASSPRPEGGPPPANAGVPAPVRADYERARYLLRQVGAPPALRAVALLESVVAQAPDYAPGHAALARALLQADPTAPGDVARRHVARALQLAPAEPEALVIRGDIRSLVDRDFDAAERDFRRAHRAAPDYVEALHHLAGLRAILGDDDGAIALMEEALELDPVSPLLVGDLAWFHFVAGDWHEARSWAHRTLELEPEWGSARSILLHASIRLGDGAAVRDHAVALLRAAGADQRTVEKVLRAADPMPAYWLWWQEHLIDATDAAACVHRAWTRAALGRIETALDDLAAADTAGYRPLVFLMRDPRFDPLRGTPRFTALLQRLGLSQAAPVVDAANFSLPSTYEPR